MTRLILLCAECGAGLAPRLAARDDCSCIVSAYCPKCCYVTAEHYFLRRSNGASEAAVPLSSPGRDGTTGAAPGEVAAPLSQGAT